MGKGIKSSVDRYFSEITDPRKDDQRRKHNLLDIIVIAQKTGRASRSTGG